MSSVYLLYSVEDSEFANRLSQDLTAAGVKHARADMGTDERFSALHQADYVIVVLSPTAITDPRVLATLSAATEIHTELIAVRVGEIKEMPKYLRGVIPLDFSQPDRYEEALDTLLDDLQPNRTGAPPTGPLALPEDVVQELDNLQAATPQQKQTLIEELATYATASNSETRAAAEQALRDIAFKEKNASLKRLAGTALQMFNQPRAKVIDSQPPRPTGMVATMTGDGQNETVEAAPTAIASQEGQLVELWQTREWYWVLVWGAILAVLHGIVAGSTPVAVGIGAVFAGLWWLNIQIRAGGAFRWEMPGPLVGNYALGAVIAVIATGIAWIFSSLAVIGFLAMFVLGGVYGALIGWLSTLYILKRP